jgi:hypothetical protein
MDVTTDRLGGPCFGRCWMATCVGFGLFRLDGRMSRCIVPKPGADALETSATI